MTVRVLASLTVNEDQPEALARYLGLMQPELDRVGAQIIDRYQIDEHVIGDKISKTIVIVEYPSRESVYEVFGSKTYELAVAFRDKAFSDYSINIIN